MTTYLVTYTATYQVTANTEAEAIDKAIEEHEQLPDGTWTPEVECANCEVITNDYRGDFCHDCDKQASAGEFSAEWDN